MSKSEQEKATWFFKTFGDRIDSVFSDTNITADLVGAIALQETGYLWNSFWRFGADTEKKFLALCVGDTVSSRGYFPKRSSDLLDAPRGEEAFAVLRSALENTARTRKSLKEYATNPHNILYGYGIFQYDLMFYKDYRDYDFFINKEWMEFEACLERLKRVMIQNMKKRNFSTVQKLDQTGKIMAALLYHRGKIYNRPLFKQGYCENKGRGPCYGAKIDRYLRMSRKAINELSSENTSQPKKKVAARSGLNLRNGPGIQFEVQMTAQYGDEVFVVSDDTSSDWILVDLEGDGIADGYMHRGFLN